MIVDSNASIPITAVHGVLQAAILSPVLFNVYTSNLPFPLKNCEYHLSHQPC